MLLKKKIRWFFALFLLLYVTVSALMFMFQRELLYHPVVRRESPQEAGLGQAQNHYFEQNGARLHYWFQPPSSAPRPLIVYFHGNGGSLMNRAAQLKAFGDLGFGFAIMSYRGYGESTGEPTEESNLYDAETFIARLTELHGIAPQRLVLFGESLGTGVAVQMAARHPSAAGLVLQSPYTSVRARAQELYPWLPVGLLLKDTYDSLAHLPKVNIPLLVLHGLRDDVIPLEHGQKLFNAASEPKELQLFETVHHSDFLPDVVARRVLDFLQAQQ